MQEHIQVGSYLFPHEAHMAKASLECAGIPSFILDENMVSTAWFFAHAIGGVKLFVLPEHEEDARQVLETDYSHFVELDSDSQKETCSGCGSKNISPYTKGKKPAFIVFALMMFPLWYFRKGMKCGECGKFWKT